MKLVIDIGNSRTKAAVFDGENLLEQYLWNDLSQYYVKEVLSKFPISQAIISSVSSPEQHTSPVLSSIPKVLHLSHKTAIPLANKYKSPETLGRDRISAAVGAYYLYPGKACMVIDAGTCITYDLVNEKGEYLGGGISPGIKMRLNAMHHFTAKLPLVDKQRLNKDIGFNTETSMIVGAQLGAVLEVDGFISRYRNQFVNLVVLITGGDNEYFVSQLKNEIFAHPNLVLYGLNKILDYNAQ